MTVQAVLLSGPYSVGMEHGLVAAPRKQMEEAVRSFILKRHFQNNS